jgi:hypothetical protein
VVFYFYQYVAFLQFTTVCCLIYSNKLYVWACTSTKRIRNVWRKLSPVLCYTSLAD